jgi:hypothetical protein
MGGPGRLLDRSSDADAFERELLGSIRDVSPPAGAKDETWASINAQIAAVGTAGALSAAAGKATGSAAWGSLLAKMGVGVAVIGTTVAAGVVWVNRAERPAPAPSVPAVVDVPIASPAEPERATSPDQGEPSTVEQPAAAPARRVSRTSEVLESPDPLGRESAIVTEARAKLQGGDPRGALATLARLRNGGQSAVLVQEREVITIQALSATGDTEAARRRAKAFVAAHPTSPHTPQMRRIADGR